MNRFLATLAFTTLFLFASCAGPRSKAYTLFPAAELTWPAVAEDFNRGVEDGVSDGDLAVAIADQLREDANKMSGALQAHDLDALFLVPWPTMEPWARRGIDDKVSDKEIGPGVAESLREQLLNFTNTINALQGVF